MCIIIRSCNYCCNIDLGLKHDQLFWIIRIEFLYCFCCYLSNAMHRQNINLPVCVCVCVRHTFCQLAYRSDPSTDFYS